MSSFSPKQTFAALLLLPAIAKAGFTLSVPACQEDKTALSGHVMPADSQTQSAQICISAEDEKTLDAAVVGELLGVYGKVATRQEQGNPVQSERFGNVEVTTGAPMHDKIQYEFTLISNGKPVTGLMQFAPKIQAQDKKKVIVPPPRGTVVTV